MEKFINLEIINKFLNETQNANLPNPLLPSVGPAIVVTAAIASTTKAI